MYLIKSDWFYKKTKISILGKIGKMEHNDKYHLWGNFSALLGQIRKMHFVKKSLFRH